MPEGPEIKQEADRLKEAIGAPLLGDPLYASGGRVKDLDALPGDLGYQLHAHRLSLCDPRGQHFHFAAPLPTGLC